MALMTRSYGESNSFLQTVESNFQRVLKYENPTLISNAKFLIPIDTLQIKALSRMREHQLCIKKGVTEEPDMLFEDALLIELMSWFKSSFFKWVDQPECRTCKGNTKYSHNTSTISSLETIRVEVFTCEQCGAQTEFPRFNDPGMLLITRKGRCGEWANCFALLCRVLKYDTRFVVDTTDHVWVEIYSHSLKRWLHCDPCENVLDTPLLYEAGWGKKLEYVIAYSRDDIQDVTWRYSSDHKAVLSRRNKCAEHDLVNFIVTLRNNRWEGLTDARKKFLKNILCVELVELMNERNANSNEQTGRTSGSLSWRLQRKETKASGPYEWKFAEHKEICIRYSIAHNLYQVVLPDETILETKKDWISGTYNAHNIFRKEENDWKKVYLARQENTNEAIVSWKVMTYSSMVIGYINIKTSSNCFESGLVQWDIFVNGKHSRIPKSHESNFTMENLNITEFIVSAKLSGGNGNQAWQHAQIFRDSLDSGDYPFQMTIKFRVVDKK